MVKVTLTICLICVAVIGLFATLKINMHEWFPDAEGAKNHVRVAKALWKEEKDSDAIAEYQKAASLDPKNADIHFQFAKALEDAGQEAEAADEFSLAVKLAPHDQKMQYKYAYFLDRQGEVEAAVRQYEQLLASPPSDKELLKDVTYFAAKDYEKLGNFERAQELYLTDLKLGNNLNGPWIGLSRCQQHFGKKRDAIATLQKGIQHLPDDATLHYDLAELLASDNQKNAAIRELKKCVEIDPNYAEDADDFIASITKGSGDTLAIIPLKKSGNSYLVHTTLNHSVEATLVLDSGADVCMISHDLANKLNLNLERSDEVLLTGITGTNAAKETFVDTIRIGSATEHNVKVAIHDLPSGEDGLLGMNFLKRYNFSIDPKRDILQLTKRTDPRLANR
jgi:clan AA aspartic protease (TIGR02281 family)